MPAAVGARTHRSNSQRRGDHNAEVADDLISSVVNTGQHPIQVVPAVPSMAEQDRDRARDATADEAEAIIAVAGVFARQSTRCSSERTARR